MQIEKKEQKEREQNLLESKDTKWRVSLFDQWENAHYKKCKKAFSKYMSDTNASSAPWYIIDADDQKWAELQVMETLVSNIEVALQNQHIQFQSCRMFFRWNQFHVLQILICRTKY